MHIECSCEFDRAADNVWIRIQKGRLNVFAAQLTLSDRRAYEMPDSERDRHGQRTAYGYTQDRA